MFDPIIVDQAADAHASFVIGITAVASGVLDRIVEQTIEHCVNQGDKYSMGVSKTIHNLNQHRKFGATLDVDTQWLYDTMIGAWSENTENFTENNARDFEALHQIEKENSRKIITNNMFNALIIIGALESNEHGLMLGIDCETVDG